MAVVSKLLATGFSIFTVLRCVAGSPLATRIETIKKLLGRDNFEWTALGDSYSSGVGAGDYVSNSYRCLRYSQAYPNLMNSDGRLPTGDHTFHNAVCSGSSTEDVELYEFYDKDTYWQPNIQFGDRPKFGQPSMATLSVGGNDIDFPGIIFNCILETNLPLGAGPPPRSCDDQRAVSRKLLQNPDLVNNIDKVIKKAVQKGRQGPVKDKFRLYVTGFPQFFSEKTDECDKVTFARTANPKDDGKDHTKMTQDLRKDFNSMSVALNKAIADAVSRNTDQGVSWIPIDDVMEGHRYCEPGVAEPDQHNPNLWLFHYPYNEVKDDAVDGPLLKAYNNVTTNVNVNSVYPTYKDFQSAILDAVELPGDPSERGVFDFFWKIVGYRVKVFHPQPPLHEKIRDKVLDAYVRDLGSSVAPPSPSSSVQDNTVCHGVSGDYWVMSRDVAVDNVRAFCSQTTKEVTYNQGSVNELSLSIKNLNDSSKTPSDSPDCTGRFQRAVIDGCDGNDPINNPHNYKFGGIFTTADGWEYKLTPLSKQVNEVSCDVSYKFFFDSFEIRGKNLPDAQFGAEGEGLRKQISGCGALTAWNFERTPNDVKFQWYASGRLPIGTKACVGRALQSAGGADQGNCHGAGKRRATSLIPRRPYGIRDWPGYGDEGKHVFRKPTLTKRDSIDNWPGYGDEGKHVFKHPVSV